MPGYAYAQRGDDVYVNLFISGSAELTSVKGGALVVKQESNYPWDGNIKITVEPARQTSLRLLIRIPGWATNSPLPGNLYHVQTTAGKAIQPILNGKAIDSKVEKGYLVIERAWKKGDVIQLELPMEIQRVYANELLTEDIGKVALQRGPLMYCAEAIDNDGKVSSLILPPGNKFTTTVRPDLLNGVVIIQGEAAVPTVNPDGISISTTTKTFTAVPYYSWAHRGEGEMTVWFPEKIKAIDLISR